MTRSPYLRLLRSQGLMPDLAIDGLKLLQGSPGPELILLSQ